MTIIKLIETNIAWDIISTLLFLFMAMVFIQISSIIGKLPHKFIMTLIFVSFVASSIYIVKSYRMYFTDRIFIIVLNWALCAKTLSYFHDKNLQKTNKEELKLWSDEEK